MGVLSAMLLAAGGILFVANFNVHHGYLWADRVCDLSSGLCDQSDWIAVLGLIAFGLHLLRQVIARRA